MLLITRKGISLTIRQGERMESMAGPISVLVTEDIASGDRDIRHPFMERTVRGATDREAAWARRQLGLDPISCLGESRH
mgnify:CR=1 FL=1